MKRIESGSLLRFYMHQYKGLDAWNSMNYSVVLSEVFEVEIIPMWVGGGRCSRLNLLCRG